MRQLYKDLFLDKRLEPPHSPFLLCSSLHPLVPFSLAALFSLHSFPSFLLLYVPAPGAGTEIQMLFFPIGHQSPRCQSLREMGAENHMPQPSLKSTLLHAACSQATWVLWMSLRLLKGVGNYYHSCRWQFKAIFQKVMMQGFYSCMKLNYMY